MHFTFLWYKNKKHWWGTAAEWQIIIKKNGYYKKFDADHC